MFLDKEQQVEPIRQKTEYFFGMQEVGCLFGVPVKNQQGFTLVELITIIIIVGILAVAAVPRFFDNNAFQARGAADQVKAALRFGQKVAIAQHGNVSVNISSAADTNCSAVLAGGNISCMVSSSVSVTPVTVTFNALGQPVPNVAVSVLVGTTTIHVEAETGYVH